MKSRFSNIIRCFRGLRRRTLAGLILRRSYRIAISLSLLLCGGFLALLIAAVVALNKRPDLSSWHTTVLKEEFTAKSPDQSLADYREREDRLFKELDERLYTKKETQAEDSSLFGQRFRKNNPADPTSYEKNLNQSFELVPENASSINCGVLLLHGMSDSPYSLHSIGEDLQKKGAHVVGLRLPGHGTAPSGLLQLSLKDMEAAVRLAVKDLSQKLNGKPLFILGYSNGAALAVQYTLDSLADDELPSPTGIIMISPAMGVSPIAALAVWQGRLGHWLGLEKLAWNSIAPEYDPYKYNSFAINAGGLVYRLTSRLHKRIDTLAKKGKLTDFPPVIAFQSVIDATASGADLIDKLFVKLPGSSNELVLYDINRDGKTDAFLTKDPLPELLKLVQGSKNQFKLTLLTNQTQRDTTLEAHRCISNEKKMSREVLSLHWPDGIYSLSHLSLPFPKTDPLYGDVPDKSLGNIPDYNLGKISLRGEKGLLLISPTNQLRLRWNPFYEWQKEQILSFLDRHEKE